MDEWTREAWDKILDVTSDLAPRQILGITQIMTRMEKERDGGGASREKGEIKSCQLIFLHQKIETMIMKKEKQYFSG